MRKTAPRSTVALAALSLALALSGTPPAAAAGPAHATPVAPQRADLSEFPKIDPDELAETYQDFLDDVEIIITADELDAFLRLGTDVQRDRFIEDFWRNRDPSPGTPDNEYKDQHYERLEYADYHFGRDTPRRGRDTDRGRYWVLLGEPMNRKELPNTQLAYPIELWFYHANPRLGIPPFFYLAFYKPYGMGEYRLYSPLVDGPMKLLNPAGESYARGLMNYDPDDPFGAGIMTTADGEIGAAYDTLQQNVDAEVAQVSLSLIPGDGSAIAGIPSLRSEMMIGDIENIPNRIMPSAAWAYRILTGDVEADVRFETLPIIGTAAVLLDPSGTAFLHYATQTDAARLNLNNYEDNYYITFEVAGALIDERQRILAEIANESGGARVFQADLSAEEARELRAGPLVHMDRIPVVGDRVRFDLVLENNVSREYGRAEFELEVPQPNPDRLRSSPPILVDRHERSEGYDRYGRHLPFQIGSELFLPSVDGKFVTGSVLRVFQQIYMPADAQPVAATYRLERGGEVVSEAVAFVSASEADRFGTVNKVTTIDLTGVEPGAYTLMADVDDDDRTPVRLDVEVVSERPLPFYQGQPGPPPTDPEVAFARAEQLRIRGDIDRAIAVLQSALERAPDFEKGVDLQTELLMDAGRYEEVDRLLSPKLVQAPNDRELLLTLAEVNSNLARYYDAIRYYERARMLSGGEESPELLNPLANAYYGDGQVAKARELLELSLSIDPEQPDVRRLLEEVLSRVRVPRR